jgi:hypothetical protein
VHSHQHIVKEAMGSGYFGLAPFKQEDFR